MDYVVSQDLMHGISHLAARITVVPLMEGKEGVQEKHGALKAHGGDVSWSPGDWTHSCCFL